MPNTDPYGSFTPSPNNCTSTSSPSTDTRLPSTPPRSTPRPSARVAAALRAGSTAATAALVRPCEMRCSKPETGKPEEGVLLAFAIREAARGALAGPQGRGCKATTRAPGTAVRRHPTPLPRRGGRALHLPMKLGISPRTVYRYKDLEEPPPRQTYTTRASVLDPYVPYLLSLLGRRLPRNGKQLLRERSAREATPTARGRSSALRQGCDVQRRPANRRLLVHRGPGKAP